MFGGAGWWMGCLESAEITENSIYVEAWLMSRKQEKILQHLENLTPQEAHFLVVALEKNAQTIYWKHDDNEVHSLKAKGLLESVPDDSPLLYRPFSIPRF